MQVKTGAAGQIEDARAVPAGDLPGEEPDLRIDRGRAPAGPVVLLRQMLGSIVPRQVVALRPGRRGDLSIQEGGQREGRHGARRCPARSRRQPAEPSAVAPPQLDPAPAVQPKQCRPVTMARASRAARSKSAMWRGAGPFTGRSSIWLKSQS